MQNQFARCLALALELCSLGYEISLKTIGQDGMALLVHQFLAFVCGNVADGREAVNTVSGFALKAVLGLHVQFLGHLGAVVGPKIVVQGLVVACYATADGCGMGGEDSCNGRYVLLLKIY